MKTAIGWMVWRAVLMVLCCRSLSAQERWVYRYNGPGNYDDQAFSIAVGPDSSLFVAGFSWAGPAGYDFTVVSLTPSGAERWMYTYNGPANDWDEARSIVMGIDGNVYAAGYSIGSGTSGDLTVVSLTPSGGERWVYRYNGSANNWDWAYSIVAGADSNLYVAGYSVENGTSADLTVVSLTPSGGERWFYRYNGPGNYEDGANCVVIGTDGNVYAAGYSTGSGTSGDFTVVSLTPSGSERWVYRYNGSASNWDWAYSIAVGADSNLYAAGYSIENGTSADFTIVSLTPSGGERWVYRYNGPGNYDDAANSVVMGAGGNLYVAGFSLGSGTSYDFTVVSLTPSGGERWVYRYNGPGNYDDGANAVAMGADSNLYAAGYSLGSGTSHDFTVVSLTPSGGERWIYRYNGPASDWDWAYSIRAGSAGDLYAAGFSRGNGTSYDFTVIGLTPDVGIEERPACPERSRGKATLELSASPVPAVGGVNIEYSVPSLAEIALSVYDGCGRLVRTLVQSREEVGSRTAVWDGRDERGSRVPGGTYFCRLTACRTRHKDGGQAGDPAVLALSRAEGSGAEVPVPSQVEVFTATRKMVVLK